MIVTCKTCKHYAGTLECGENYIHIHDYCDAWRKEIPNMELSGITINGYTPTDVECGEAYCWMWCEKE